MSPDDCLPDDDEPLLLLGGNWCASCVPVGPGPRLRLLFSLSGISCRLSFSDEFDYEIGG